MDSGERVQELLDRGNAALRQARGQEAVQLYSQALQIDATSACIWLNRSLAFSKLQRWQQARADAQQAVRLHPRWPKAHYRLAASLVEAHSSGDDDPDTAEGAAGQLLDAAQQVISSALALWPEDAQLRQLQQRVLSLQRASFQLKRLHEMQQLQKDEKQQVAADAERQGVAQAKFQGQQAQRAAAQAKAEARMLEQKHRGYRPPIQGASSADGEPSSTLGNASSRRLTQAKLRAARDLLGLNDDAAAAEHQLHSAALQVESGGAQAAASTAVVQRSLRKAYLRKAATLHPDKGGDVAEFIELQAAYEALVNHSASL